MVSNVRRLDSVEDDEDEESSLLVVDEGYPVAFVGVFFSCFLCVGVSSADDWDDPDVVEGGGDG